MAIAAGGVIQGCFPGGLLQVQRPLPATCPPPLVQPAMIPGGRPQPAPRSSAGSIQRDTRVASGNARIALSATNTAFTALPPDLAHFEISTPGQPLPVSVRQSMEAAFGASFANVRVHAGAQAARVGAIAITRGNNLYFAPGHYNPHTPQGRKLLAHELTHVVQQRAGRVRNPLGSGTVIVQNAALEAEADRMAQRAMFMPAQSAPGRPGPTAKASPIQARMAGQVLHPRFNALAVPRAFGAIQLSDAPPEPPRVEAKVPAPVPQAAAAAPPPAPPKKPSGNAPANNVSYCEKCEKPATRKCQREYHPISVRPARYVAAGGGDEDKAGPEVQLEALKGAVSCTMYLWNTVSKKWQPQTPLDSIPRAMHVEKALFTSSKKHRPGDWIGFDLNAWPCDDPGHSCKTFFTNLSEQYNFVFRCTTSRYVEHHPEARGVQGYVYFFGGERYYNRKPPGKNVPYPPPDRGTWPDKEDP